MRYVGAVDRLCDKTLPLLWAGMWFLTVVGATLTLGFLVDEWWPDLDRNSSNAKSWLYRKYDRQSGIVLEWLGVDVR